MTDTTARLNLPLLAAGQAQKELTHNEALTLADIAVQAVVEAVAPAAVPVTPQPGQCWVVGDGPTGSWTDRAGAVAGWTAGGWRFLAARDGMAVWSIADATIARRVSGAWVIGALTARILTIGSRQVVGPQLAPVSAPQGGTVVDQEARAAIASILARLGTHGLIASA